MRFLHGSAVVILLVTGVIALAQETRRGPISPPFDNLADAGERFRATVLVAPNSGDVAKGQLVAMGGRPQGAASQACFRCHGTDGAGDGAANFPRLSQLPAWYMNKQLEDYVSGSRPNDVMAEISRRLSAEERAAVSTYYSLAIAPHTSVAPGPVGPDQLQWGGVLASVGSAARGIPGCVNCHGAGGEGLPPSVPNLAGQHASYTAAQLWLWKSGVRRNDPMNVMASIAVKMTDKDIEAVAAYFAQMAPSEASGANGPRLAPRPAP